MYKAIDLLYKSCQNGAAAQEHLGGVMKFFSRKKEQACTWLAEFCRNEKSIDYGRFVQEHGDVCSLEILKGPVTSRFKQQIKALAALDAKQAAEAVEAAQAVAVTRDVRAMTVPLGTPASPLGDFKTLSPELSWLFDNTYDQVFTNSVAGANDLGLLGDSSPRVPGRMSL